MIDRVAEPALAPVAAAWLATLQQIAEAVGHELRNALNGVAVNVEVLRSRTQRDGVDAKSLAPFATNAADQVELSVALSEALLRLTRPARIPLDLVALVADLRTLLSPIAARAGAGELDVDARTLAPLTCDAVRADACRMVVGATMLAAARSGGVAQVRAEGDARLAVMIDGGEPLALSADLAFLAQRAGIALNSSAKQVVMTFNSASR